MTMALQHHVEFTVPHQGDVASLVVDHFLDRGFELIDERPGKWRFRRGSKFAWFWRHDIRAYATELIVRALAQPSGATWVSCDFDVATTALNFVTRRDVATLDAEARELETLLRHAIEVRT